MANAYFGQAAYEGFARGFASLLGIPADRISVSAGDGPCIDVNGHLHLPGINGYQSADEFESTCGSIVHELAHLWCGSHRQLSVKRSRLAADCLNAVLDVADETSLARTMELRGLPRAGELLRRGNAKFLTWARGQSPAMWDWRPENRTPVHWRILAAGIIVTRLAETCEKRLLTRKESLILGRVRRFQTANVKHAANIDFAKVLAVLYKARSSAKGVRKTDKALLKLGSELEALLATVAPPDDAPTDAPGEPMPGQQPQGGGQGLPSVPAGDREADAVDGAAAVTASVADGRGPGAAPAASPASTSGPWGVREARPAARALCAPAVATIAQRLAVDGDGLDREDGHSRGTMVAQPYRLATDGLCMGRWQDDLPADGMSVAVLLDCSGSMDHVLEDVAGVAQAFAQEMRQCGAVKCWRFGHDATESPDDFAKVELMGGTNTHKALSAAREWLAGCAGAKWIVLVTDGDPSHKGWARDQCAAAVAAGCRVLSVGFQCAVPLPGAINVTAADVPRLAIELQAAASMIASAR